VVVGPDKALSGRVVARCVIDVPPTSFCHPARVSDALHNAGRSSRARGSSVLTSGDAASIGGWDGPAAHVKHRVFSRV
jgi:hypothetical protein